MQNLTIDYSTDTNGRFLSADYNETGGFSGNLTFVYDNFGNIIAFKLDDGDMAKAVLINPNNGAIDTRYDPNDIDDPFSYRARDGFMGIGPLWANNDDGTVYMQGHVVIPNPWGNVSTNGTTTTTTDDTTDKDGGDEVRPCGICPPGYVWTCIGVYTAECVVVINGQNVKILYTKIGDPRGNESTVESEIEYTCPNGKKVKAKLRKFECSCKPEPYAY